MYTHLEDFIQELYRKMSISRPSQLSIAKIAKRLNINVYFSDFSYRSDNNIIIKRSTRQKEWQLFGHEVCHYLKHCGSQLDMNSLFIDLQEYQANHFAYHFCVPTFMLEDLKEVNIHDVMDLFNVEYDFALKRIEMYERKIILARSYCKKRE